MIEPTDAMGDAFHAAWCAYWTAHGNETPEGGPTVAEHGRAAYRAGLAAAFEVVEKAYDVRAKPRVHLAIRGDWHVHCCGTDVAALPIDDDVTLNPHAVTCKGAL